MNNKNFQSGERLSFFKLFQEKKYRIVIPIIQRDYAQGRQSSQEVRDVFLDALYDYLDDNKPNRDLDFVYGTLINQTEYTDFIPLDGQQRLTTLFLLHWYLYQISSDEENKLLFKQALLREDRSMFSYETRMSSSEFCDAMMRSQIDPSNLFENSFSKTVENSAWFFGSWKNDPTIKSMLVMLDAIHERFCGQTHFFSRLLDIENPIITFLFLNLKDYKLTDDLYIKMNSRGKPLTPFENFKAKFEQHLEGVEVNRKFQRNYEGKGNPVTIKEYFSFNIDTAWANLFWNYRHLVGDSDVFDDELKNFIRVIFTNSYGASRESDQNFEYLLGTQVAKKRSDYSDSISYYKYKELEAITNEGILYLIDSFESLVNGNNKVKNILSEPYQSYFSEDSIFEKVLKNDFSNQERIMFHAYIKFLIANPTDKGGIEQWIRTIHNLTYNRIIDGADEVSRALKSIDKMLPASRTIIDYLEMDSHIDFFSGWQVLEERIKAALIKKNNHWKVKIEQFEKHSYFRGQIGFILEFSEIKTYYLNNKNCNWTLDEDDQYFTSFVYYGESALAVFDNKKLLNERFAWERAVLSKGDYLITATSWRKNFLKSESNSRDFSWKRLLRFDENSDKRKFVKDVFDDSLFDKADLERSLEKICLQKSGTWRDYFIEIPELMKDSPEGFVRFENESNIRIYSRSQLNSKHTEMYSRYLWFKYFETQNNTAPFTRKYMSSQTSEECAKIRLSNFCHHNILYEVNIFHDVATTETPVFQIIFSKSKDQNNVESYGDDVTNVLYKNKFEWNEEKICYSTQVSGLRNTYDLISGLIDDCRSLKEVFSEPDVNF